MTCIKCRKPSVVFFQEPLCNGCFIKGVQARVKRELRGLERDTVLSLAEESVKDRVAKDIINAVLKTPIQFKPNGKLVLSWSAEDIGAAFIKHMVEKSEMPKALFPLRSVLNAEIKHYAKVKNIEGKEDQNSTYKEMMEKIAKQYPGTPFSMQKSIEALLKVE